jgi:lipopolysaccharide export system protein LptA
MQKNILFLLLLSPIIIAKDISPLTVTADQMTYNDKTKTSTAIGHAIATLQNADGTQILEADSMTAHHNTDDMNGINTLHATSTKPNHVLFKSPTLTITATTCHYDGKAQNIVCSGCVKVTDLKKHDTVTGDKAEINIQTKVYSIQSFGDHVSEAIIHTGSA